MSKAIIFIVYHSVKSHTAQLAALPAEKMTTGFSQVNLFTTDEAQSNFELLHKADTIVFGCPTCFGNVSAVLKQFVEGALGGFGTQWLVVESVLFAIATILFLLQRKARH